MTTQSHKQYMRLPNNEALKKLEDLIEIELNTIQIFINKASEVKARLLSDIKDDEYRTNLSTAYDQKFSEILYTKHLDSLMVYVSLLAYAQALNNRNVLYAYEDNWGNMQITYMPYIIKRNGNR